jgi:hypothetical protein
MSRRARQLNAPQRPPPSAQLAPPAPAPLTNGTTYLCVACELRWPYRVVRNTGRCPTCGGGLLRTDPPER